MRIIAGQWRGRRLASVGKGDASAHLRPTSDRVRESLFSILTGGRFDDPIADAAVLDLFAGTGALGLEALSRGARSAMFVENGRTALGLLQSNIKSLQANAKVMRLDATKLKTAPTAASLVFLDPPYGKGLGQKALSSAAEGGWVAQNALIVWEENASQTPPDCFSLLDERRFGDTTVSFLQYAP